jgi:hypothetical protein
MQLMASLNSGLAEGHFPDLVESKGDIYQGDKGGEPVVEQDEKSRQDVSEINLLEGKALPHGSTPMQKSICPMTLLSEEVEDVLDTSNVSAAPRKWTRRARIMSPSQYTVQVGKRGHDEVASAEGVSSKMYVKKGRMEAEDPTDEVKAVAGPQPRQLQ